MFPLHSSPKESSPFFPRTKMALDEATGYFHPHSRPFAPRDAVLLGGRTSLRHAIVSFGPMNVNLPPTQSSPESSGRHQGCGLSLVTGTCSTHTVPHTCISSYSIWEQALSLTVLRSCILFYAGRVNGFSCEEISPPVKQLRILACWSQVSPGTSHNKKQ